MLSNYYYYYYYYYYDTELHRQSASVMRHATANLRTKIPDFRRFDSIRILVLMGGIPRPIWEFPEGLSQATLVGIILVGRLGVHDGYPSVTTSRGRGILGLGLETGMGLEIGMGFWDWEWFWDWRPSI